MPGLVESDSQGYAIYTHSLAFTAVSLDIRLTF